MATLSANQLKIFFRAVQAGASGYGGANVVEVNIDERPATGTTNGQWNLTSSDEYTISSSGTQATDFTALSGPNGTTVDYGTGSGEVAVAVVIHDADSAASSISVTPNATNGWVSAIEAAGDKIRLKPGQGFALFDFNNGPGWDVSSSVKALDIVNNDGSNAASVTLKTFGRSA